MEKTLDERIEDKIMEQMTSIDDLRFLKYWKNEPAKAVAYATEIKEVLKKAEMSRSEKIGFLHYLQIIQD